VPDLETYVTLCLRDWRCHLFISIHIFVNKLQCE